MIKLLVPIASILLLAGCANNPPPTFGVDPIEVPDIPEQLNKKAYALPPIEDSSLGGLVRSGNEAAAAYNEVAFRNNALIDFYNCVKESINEEAVEIEQCLGLETDDQ